jgi:hypothetical protein
LSPAVPDTRVVSELGVRSRGEGFLEVKRVDVFVEIWIKSVAGLLALVVLSIAAWRQFRSMAERHDPFDPGVD